MFLDSLQQQLKVQPDQALIVADKLLDAKLQCSLGGQYSFERSEAGSGREFWQSTAWPKQFAMMKGPASTFGFDSTKALPPQDYKAPWLQWFRGSELHLTQLPERLVVVGTIDIEPLPALAEESAGEKPAAGTLPKMELDLFNLPFQFFQGDKPKTEKEAGKKPTENRKSF